MRSRRESGPDTAARKTQRSRAESFPFSAAPAIFPGGLPTPCTSTYSAFAALHGGIAAIAKVAGHRVTGCDAMSTREEHNIRSGGHRADRGVRADQTALNPTCGNRECREPGNPLMEAITRSRRPLCFRPANGSLKCSVRQARARRSWTHGKTTTSCMVAWIPGGCGTRPGVPHWAAFRSLWRSARLGAQPVFVIEADEIRYRLLRQALQRWSTTGPRLRFEQYEVRFMRTSSPDLQRLRLNSIISSERYPDPAKLIVQRCRPWRLTSSLAAAGAGGTVWRGRWLDANAVGTGAVSKYSTKAGRRVAPLDLQGEHNLQNALAAVGPRRRLPASIRAGHRSLARFQGVPAPHGTAGTVADVAVWDDFAHHRRPSRRTVSGLR